jgi:hypothetical protein
MAIEEVFQTPEFRAHMAKLGKKGGASRSQAKRLASQQNAVKGRQARWAGREGQTTRG